MSKMRELCLACLCLLFPACSGPTAPTVPLNHEFTLAPAEAALIEEIGLMVRFLGVQGDSRCPADAVCIQGGDARVKIEAASLRAGAESYDLHTGDMRPVQHDGVTISLVQLMPYPFSSRTIQPDDYRATLVVSR